MHSPHGLSLHLGPYSHSERTKTQLDHHLPLIKTSSDRDCSEGPSCRHHSHLRSGSWPLSLGHMCSSRVFAQALLVLAHQWNYNRFRLLDTSSPPLKVKLTLLSSCLCVSSTQNKFPADWFSMNLKFQGLCQPFVQ